MITILETIEIKDVRFNSNTEMSLFLSNGRILLVPLDQFREIANLTQEERCDFEVIDGDNLSFLAIDEVYNLRELMGL